ncbi:MAG: gliding motility-associated C-terminal domain-containing protein, partial [Bacteroidota bacterium]|nr:gliding motility-associated C-terminal domain-containing protein [Bacteroidota bacterium]
AVGFSIGCKGYVGTGWRNDSSATVQNDFWEYDPGSFANIVANAASSAQTLCAGQTATLTACCGVNYLWSNGSTSNPAVVTVIGTTTYSVIASDVCDSDTAAVTVTVIPLPTAALAGTSTLCQGLSTTLTASGGNSYLWNNGSTNNSVVISPPATATYSVIVTGVCGNDTASVLITVFPIPNAVFSTQNTIDTCSSQAFIQLTNNSAGANAWQWDIDNDGMMDYTSQNPSYTVSLPVNYLITLIASNVFGCTDTVKQSVNIPAVPLPPLYIPNAFSPNGDNENDKLYVYGKCIKQMTLIIYDRWGGKVFETHDQKIGWEGIYIEAKENSAVFTYYLEAILYSGDVVRKKGNVSLMR